MYVDSKLANEPECLVISLRKRIVDFVAQKNWKKKFILQYLCVVSDNDDGNVQENKKKYSKIRRIKAKFLFHLFSILFSSWKKYKNIKQASHQNYHQ